MTEIQKFWNTALLVQIEPLMIVKGKLLLQSMSLLRLGHNNGVVTISKCKSITKIDVSTAHLVMITTFKKKKALTAILLVCNFYYCVLTAKTT